MTRPWEHGREGSSGMVHCKHCATANCLDALFCKKCGTALSQEDVKEAQARLDVLLVEGRKAFEEGRTEEALAVTERILDSNPSMNTAIALRMEVHARRGEIAQALDCADRLVELNPDSEIDKIRRDGLRAQLAESLRPAPAPDRRFAMVAGLSAVVLVACIGVLAARLSATPKTPDTLIVNNDGATVQTPVTDPQITPVQNQIKPNANTGLGADDVQAIRDGEEIVINSNQRIPTGSVGGTLPGPSGTQRLGGTPNFEVAPEVPVITGPIGGGTGGNGTLPPAGGKPPTDITITRPNKPSIDPPPVADGEQKDEGVYEFKIKSGSGSKPQNGNTIPSGSIEPAASGNGAEALLRTGTQYYQLGNYSGAAGAYEKALAAGADPLNTNQRLAMAYDNLGRKSEATGAYRRAITAGEAMLASGKGNPDRVRSAIETCKAAIG
ncbi:tetratricopeptide repeat protein, partial [bacterium]